MRLILLSATLLVMTLPLLAAQSPNVLNFKVLIEQVKESVPKPYRDLTGSYMDGADWLDRSQAAELQKALQTNWPEFLDSFRDIAPDDASQEILLIAAQGLTGRNYLQFMSRAIDLAREGAISHREFIEWGLRPQRPPLRTYLMDSYQDPQVRELIEKAKGFFADDPRKQIYFDNMLSGKMKKDYWEFIADGPSTPKGLPRMPNTDPAANPLGRRVGPPARTKTNSESTLPSHNPAVAVTANEHHDTSNQIYLWISVAGVILFASLWIFLRSRKKES